MGTKRDTARHTFKKPLQAHEKAAHMARYSSASWIAWSDKENSFAQIETKESIKAALLAVGTSGHFYQYIPRSRHASRVGWGVGLIMFRNHRSGHMNAMSFC